MVDDDDAVALPGANVCVAGAVRLDSGVASVMVGQAPVSEDVAAAHTVLVISMTFCRSPGQFARADAQAVIVRVVVENTVDVATGSVSLAGVLLSYWYADAVGAAV